MARGEIKRNFIGSQGDFEIAIDRDAGQTTKRFIVSKDAAVPNSGTELFSVREDGQILAGPSGAHGVTITEGFTFTEAGSTTYTATAEIPAGALIRDVGFCSTVLWDDGTSASLSVGDDDVANGWFNGINLKATDLLVGEVLSAADDGLWGGKPGAYLTAAGRRGRTTAGVDSGWYCGAATEVIFVITTGGQDGSAGRSFGWVTYTIPSWTAATGA